MGDDVGGQVTAPGPAGGEEHRPDAPPGRLFWPAVALGWVVMAAGATGLLTDAGRTRPAESVRFVLGAAVVHDLLLAPVVVAAGWAVARVVPKQARGPVQAAMIVSSVVALFAVPFVRGYGRVSTNPSILPRNYGAGLAVILVAVWVVVAVAVGRRWMAHRPAARHDGDAGADSVEAKRPAGWTPQAPDGDAAPPQPGGIPPAAEPDGEPHA